MSESQYYQGGLRSLPLKCRYKSPADDILEEFFIPALRASKYYYRVAGFFSSDVLSVAAKGVAAFVRSGERMRLIVGGILREEDVEAINRGHATPEEVLERNLGAALANLEDALVIKRLEVLAWLVSVSKLEIRVALPLGPDEQILPSRVAYWHKKFAIFEDSKGDRLQIEGSINETRAGWCANSEAFSVHKSWEQGQREYVDDALEEFFDLWEGKAVQCLVLDMPSATRKALLKYRPDEPPTVEPVSETALASRVDRELGNLWPHQQQAVESWLENNRRGILAMATGSGKTRAALSCVSRTIEHGPITLILVPTLQLLKQWQGEITRWFPGRPIVLCSGETDWRRTLPARLLVAEGPMFLISTMQTSSGQDLEGIVTKLAPRDRLFLVVDEVHHIGAPKYGRVLDWCDPELGRIGLSATPERAWDTIGTDRIFEYFGGVVYEYGLRDAIRDGYLCKYQYFPRFVSLDEEELAEYLNLSKRIARHLAMLGGATADIRGIDDERLHALLVNRARIIKSARGKISMAAKIISEEDLSRCLVYCDTESQIDELAELLEHHGMVLATYTSKVVGRDIALDRFSKGHVDLLLAIKCLDEGIDIPWCKDALILASSSNSGEFIQRRGRILRRHRTKEHARIFDIGVLPFDPALGPRPLGRLYKAELGILRREMDRVQLFLQDAENFVEQQVRILKIRQMIAKMPAIEE